MHSSFLIVNEILFKTHFETERFIEIISNLSNHTNDIIILCKGLFTCLTWTNIDACIVTIIIITRYTF